MDQQRLESIEALLQKMREENERYRKQENLAKTGSLQEEEEQGIVMSSRYNHDFPMLSKNEASPRSERDLKEIKTKKEKLGPPLKVSKTDDVKPMSRTLKRPLTSKTNKPTTRKKKNDPVSLYQLRTAEWKSQTFLKSGSNLKEGRKLNLNKWPYVGLTTSNSLAQLPRKF